MPPPVDSHVRPADESELIDAIRGLVADGTPAQLIGGGSKPGFGRPVNAAVTLQLDALSGIQAYEAEELTLTSLAGTRVADIEAALRECNQELAFEPPDFGPLYGTPAGGATIGGVIACNLAGARRVRAGGARDHFLGFRAVSGRGEAFKAGGHVVKNVSGYDLCKLLAGSFGTLAALTEVTVKVLPRAPQAHSLVLPGRSLDDAVRVLVAAAQSPLEPSGYCCFPGDLAPALLSDLQSSADVTVAIRFEGPSTSVRDRMTRMAEQVGGARQELDDSPTRALWKAVSDAAPFAEPEAVQAERPLWRLSVPMASGASVITNLAANPGGRWLLDGTMLWFESREAASAAPEVRGAAAEAGGTATLLRAPASVRVAEGVFAPQSPGLAGIAKAIRAGFDPEGILNPGRMGT